MRRIIIAGRFIISRLGVAAIGLALVGCLFDGAETEGLICENDDHCGISQTCVAGTCQSELSGCAGVETNVCNGPRTFLSCVADQVSEVHCDEVCAGNGLGRALACRDSPEDGSAGCYCDESSSFCDQDQFVECGDEDDLRYCTGGVWDWQDCDWLCGTNGKGSGTSCGYDSMFGEDVCSCTGNECEPGAQYCSGTDQLTVCDAGAWSEVTCDAELCDGGISVGCGYLTAIGDEACLCAG